MTKLAFNQINGNVVNVFDFMTAAEIADVSSYTGSLDVSGAIQTAVNSFTRAGILIFPPGDYYTTSEIQVEKVGLTLRGAGPGSYADGTAGYGTRIKGGHTAGAVIRIMLESCVIENMLIDADATRSAASRDTTAANCNAGIRVEADDVAPPEGDVFDTIIRQVHVNGQPGDGIIMVGRIYASFLHKVVSADNGGHGLTITNGEITGRSNTALAGIVNIENCTFDNNEGHSVCAGQNNSTDYTIRIVYNNCEGLNNCGTPALLEDASDSFFHCDSLTWINGAATGTAKSGASPATNAGTCLMGLGGSLIEPRILDTTEPVRVIKHPSRDSKGWTIHNPHIRTTAAAYVAYIDAGVENIKIWCGDETGGLTSATSIVGVNGLDSYIADKHIITGAFEADDIQTSYGMVLSPTKANNLNVTTTPQTILDASTQGKKWVIHGMQDAATCTSSFSCEVVGGATPVVSNVVNQAGASITYAVTVSGTNIQLATSSSTRNTDLTIKEVIA